MKGLLYRADDTARRVTELSSSKLNYDPILERHGDLVKYKDNKDSLPLARPAFWRPDFSDFCPSIRICT
jgi:hypothetical protein